MRLLIPLFSPPTGTYGSLTRALAFADYFKSRGDIIAFCASGEIQSIIERKGYNVYTAPESTFLGLPKPLSNIIARRSQNSTPPVKEGRDFGNIWMVYALTGMTKKSYLHRLVDAQLTAINDFHPDLLFTEMDPGAYVASYISKVPLVTTYAHISQKGSGTFFWKKMKNAMNHVLHLAGYKKPRTPEEIVFRSDVLKVIPSIPELDSTPPAREDVFYAGNIIAPIKDTESRFIPEPEKKYIFVYLGTGSVSLKQAERVLPSALNHHEDIVCIVAAQSIKEKSQTGNVHFVPYVQASELLPHCILTICHGGLNTVTQSLGFGVPLMLFPGAIFERRFNSRQVVANSSGFMGELSNFNAEWINERLSELETTRAGVESLRNSFAKQEGMNGVYERIQKWMKG